MYSSLRKADFVVQDKANPEKKVAFQTDHRSVDEVAAEEEISVLFALTRILVPQRHGNLAVRYVALAGLHPALARVVASTGATASVGGPADENEVDLSDVPRAAPADLADQAFASLGKKLLAAQGLEADEQGLAAFEEIIAERDLSADDNEDEIAYWTGVVELAAVTGEVFRAKFGGRWVADPKDYADIPFMFQDAEGSGLTNAVGKAMNFIEHGEGHSPRQLLRGAEDRNTPEGPLLPNLKPSHWGMRNEAICEPFAPDLKNATDVPLVVYGHDRPNTFAMMMRNNASARPVDELRAEAIRNLAAIEVEVERIALESITFWHVYGDFFAAEKVLDVAFMNRMHAELGAEAIAAAIPEKGHLFLTNAVAQPETIRAFMAVAQGAYERNDGGRQVSPTVFLVLKGAVVGVASVSSEEEAPKKKGLFSRLFH